LLPAQARVRVPVLRESGAQASISRVGLPAPLHLAPSLLRYAPLSQRERLAAVRAALALKRLDPDDPALDERGFGDWLAAHGQSANAVAALWNLIALPTLNLPPGEAAPAAAAQGLPTGPLDSGGPAHHAIPAPPVH